MDVTIDGHRPLLKMPFTDPHVNENSRTIWSSTGIRCTLQFWIHGVQLNKPHAFQVSQFPEQVVASFCAEKQAAHFGNLHVYSSLISGGRCKLDIGWLRHVLPPTRGRSLTYKYGGVKASRRYGREQKVRHSTRTAIYLGKLYYPFKRGSNHLSTLHACGEGGVCANRRT